MLIALRCFQGQFLGITNDASALVVADRNQLTRSEVFELVEIGNLSIALKACTGQYVCAENGGGQELRANRSVVGDWETFTVTALWSGNVAFRTHNGQYACAEHGGGHQLVADRTQIFEWEAFEVVPLDNDLKTISGRKLRKLSKNSSAIQEIFFPSVPQVAPSRIDHIKLRRSQIQPINVQKPPRLYSYRITYDDIVNRIKNHPIGAILLLAAAILPVLPALGDYKLVDLLAPKKETLAVSLEIQRYVNFLGPIGPPKILPRINGYADDPARSAKLICTKIADLFKPKLAVAAFLEIDGSSMKASEPLYIGLRLARSAKENCVQIKELEKNKQLDFSFYFKDAKTLSLGKTAVIGPDDLRKGSRTLCLSPIDCCFSSESVTIYKKERRFSFSPDSHLTHRTIRFGQRKRIILLETSEGGLAGRRSAESIGRSLIFEIRKGIQDIDYLQLCPLKRQDLTHVGSGGEILNSPNGPDFLVKIVPEIRQRRFVFWLFPM